MNDQWKRKPWRLPHRETWLTFCLLVAAGVYLNLNIADLLYRIKYGPVRPSLAVSGWPIDAVDADVISAVLRVDEAGVITDACVVLAIALGAAVRVEQRRRSGQCVLRVTSERLAALTLLAAVVLAMELVNRSNSLVDPIDFVEALRWPASECCSRVCAWPVRPPSTFLASPPPAGFAGSGEDADPKSPRRQRGSSFGTRLPSGTLLETGLVSSSFFSSAMTGASFPSFARFRDSRGSA